jgi:glutathione S-transferase
MHQLVTLAFSHYNEKARWALDWCGIGYRERGFLPGFSQVAVMVATRGRGGRADRVSSRWSTPVLIADTGETLCDSTEIAQWASQRSGRVLFPDPEVERLVTALGTDLGPYTRLVAYFHVLRTPAMMRELAIHNVGTGQALAYRALAPLGTRWLTRKLRIDEDRAARATDKVMAQLTMIEARLARGRYLVGNEFTAADLTFAALLAPVAVVSRAEGYGAWLPEIATFPPDVQALVDEIRGRPAGQFALEMYRRHRVSPSARA